MPKVIVQNFCDRRQTVGRAGRIGNDRVIGRQSVVVHTKHNRLVRAACRSRDKHLLGAVLKMHRRLFAGGEDPGTFKRNVDVTPRQFLRIANGGHLDRASTDVDRLAVDLDLCGEAAMNAVELKEMRVRLDRAEIVDGDNLDVGSTRFNNAPQNVPTDATEPVDGNLDHKETPVCDAGPDGPVQKLMPGL